MFRIIACFAAAMVSLETSMVTTPSMLLLLLSRELLSILRLQYVFTLTVTLTTMLPATAATTGFEVFATSAWIILTGITAQNVGWL
jgi:hypothetical protein